MEWEFFRVELVLCDGSDHANDLPVSAPRRSTSHQIVRGRMATVGASMASCSTERCYARWGKRKCSSS